MDQHLLVAIMFGGSCTMQLIAAVWFKDKMDYSDIGLWKSGYFWSCLIVLVAGVVLSVLYGSVLFMFMAAPILGFFFYNFLLSKFLKHFNRQPVITAMEWGEKPEDYQFTLIWIAGAIFFPLVVVAAAHILLQ